MRRRDVIVGVLLAASATTRMQTTLARDRPKMPRVGYLGTNIGHERGSASLASAEVAAAKIAAHTIAFSFDRGCAGRRITPSPQHNLQLLNKSSILKTDERSIVFEPGLGGKFSAKSTAWDENRVFLEGDKLEAAVKNGRWC